MPLHTTKEQMDAVEAIANKEKLVELYDENDKLKKELREAKQLQEIQQDYYRNLKAKFEEMELDYKIKARIAELQNTTIKKYFEIFKQKDKEIELIKSSCKHPDFDWNEFCPWNHCENTTGFVDTNTYYYNNKYKIHLCKTCFKTTTEGKELFKLVE